VTSPDDRPVLERRLGLGGAVAIGLAAMLGTGVFAAWTPALSWAGPLLLVSLGIAAVVAALNAWSTVALARVHPEAGGAYAYGRIRLGRGAGLVAGWAFVLGKVASAGAAALTVGAYLWPAQQRLVAVIAIVAVVLLDLRGVTRTALASAVSAGAVLVVLALVVVEARWGDAAALPDGPVLPTSPGAFGLLAGAGLLFVAFAGYARIATLGEEVRDPARVLPRAVLVSLVVVLVVYVAVAAVVLLRLGPVPPDLRSTAPLEQVAGEAWLAQLVRAGAVVAAGGALLSLVAGVGRTLFAMARGGDAPRGLSAVSAYAVPHRAQLVAAAGAAVVVLAGGIGAALAVSGTSILLYYGVAHLAALRLGPDEGRPPRAVPVVGLLGCAVVAGSLVLVGTGLVATGG
jgi:APA family basic amino acid/polyamine antiporter